VAEGFSGVADVEIFGPTSWNLIVRLARLPEPRPHTIFAEAGYETLGGTSAGKALHLHDRGRSVHLHTVIGDDPAGGRIVATLSGAGVPTDAVVVPGPSERHLNLMTGRGERVSIYLSVPGHPPRGAVGEWRDHLASSNPIAVVADLSGWTRRDLEEIGDLDVPLWVDLHDYDGMADFHAPFAAAASYLFVSVDRLADPWRYLHLAIDGGARLAVCTAGADGAMAVDAQQREYRVAAAAIDRVVDTNGAGDAFFAGCLDATLGGSEIPEALDAGRRQALRALASRHLSPLVPEPS
jgi:sugar/nucleoside kinase (ribokinase family)